MRLSTEIQRFLADLAAADGNLVFPEGAAPYSVEAVLEARELGLVKDFYPSGGTGEYYTLTNNGRIAIGMPPKPTLYSQLLTWLDQLIAL